MSYIERSKKHPNALARQLLRIVDEKKSNLCISVDVTQKKDLLDIVDASGPYVCCVKTHIDIVSDFDDDLVAQLTALSAKHNFIIWEDRKFADIGNTVELQYGKGIYKIASWAHLTNAHTVPGEGIITGLKRVGLPLDRGLLLLAEMSSAGNLATGAYTAETLQMSRRHTDFVMGFVAMRRFEDENDFIIFTPGVNLDVTGDGKGQQYRTPEQVITESLCDVIIVGRGIYSKGLDQIPVQCEKYQKAGWDAYLKRL